MASNQGYQGWQNIYIKDIRGSKYIQDNKYIKDINGCKLIKDREYSCFSSFHWEPWSEDRETMIWFQQIYEIRIFMIPGKIVSLGCGNEQIRQASASAECLTPKQD